MEQSNQNNLDHNNFAQENVHPARILLIGQFAEEQDVIKVVTSEIKVGLSALMILFQKRILSFLECSS